MDMDNLKQPQVTPAQSKKVAVALGLSVMIFLVGTLFGITLSKEPQTKEVEVEKNVSVWRELKEIDDQTFLVAVKSSELSSAAFYAVSQGDKGTIQAVTAEAKKNSQEFDRLKDKRKEILTKLGY
jgi:hypothetical protein